MSNEEVGPFRTQEGQLLYFWEDAKEYGNPSEHLFASVLMVRVMSPGDAKSSAEYEAEVVYREDKPHSVHGPVRRNEIVWNRFGRYIKDFKETHGQQLIKGTPIDKCAFISKAQVYTLKANGIHSVEDLAGLSDTGLAPLGPGGRKMVQDAKDYLSASEKTAGQMQAAERERNMQGQIDRLSEQLAQLADAFAELPTEQQETVKASLAKKTRKAA